MYNIQEYILEKLRIDRNIKINMPLPSYNANDKCCLVLQLVWLGGKYVIRLRLAKFEHFDEDKHTFGWKDINSQGIISGSERILCGVHFNNDYVVFNGVSSYGIIIPQNQILYILDEIENSNYTLDLSKYIDITDASLKNKTISNIVIYRDTTKPINQSHIDKFKEFYNVMVNE